MITNAAIAAILHKHQANKEEARVLKVELMRIAVEELGMEQEEAKRTDLVTFLDGYLVGKGFMQTWRNIK